MTNPDLILFGSFLVIIGLWVAAEVYCAIKRNQRGGL